MISASTPVKTLVVLLLLTGMAMASEANRLVIAQLEVGKAPLIRPSATLVLAQETRFRTAVEVKLEKAVVRLDSPTIFEYPLIWWAGKGSFVLRARELAQLRLYLESGGTLLVDNVGQQRDMTAFDRSFRREMARVFPGRPLQTLESHHVLFRAFYRLTSVWGRRTANPHVEGLILDGRLVLVYNQNDLSGALSRDGFGNWEFEAVPGGPTQREEAIRFGINVVMYALLQDYKDEQSHVQTLFLKRRMLPESETPFQETP